MPGPDPVVPTELLTGWGRTAPTGARLHSPADAAEVARLVRGGGTDRPLLARGLGRGYGDAAQSAGGEVISTLRLDGLSLDERTGVAVAGAGLSLDRLLCEVVPRGWFPGVVPGTRHITVGGAVAADVHGKNHHVSGTFGEHVEWLELVDGLGALRRASPGDEAFLATTGGLGLTGVVTRAALRLLPVTSSWMSVDTERAADLDAVLAALRDQDRRRPYTVAWLDTMSAGRGFGRGVVTSGEHAAASDVLGSGVRDPLAYRPAGTLRMPSSPLGLVGVPVMRAFNEAWFRRAPIRATGELQPLEAFFHPLDRVAGWNRLYGPRGFLQYQFVVPDGREDVVATAIRELARERVPSSLAVLKRFGAASRAPLSFPRPGWTLALDIPAARPDRLAPVLDRLDLAVADAGGAVYLVKDSRVRPDVLGTMYPRLGEWRAMRERLDPRRRFGSDLSRRTGL